MSGGSYDYVYNYISNIEIENCENNPRREKFQQLLKLVAKAMHDIEWVDSDDYGPGDEDKAIDAVFDFCKQEQWQPIETAPMDGTIILIGRFHERTKYWLVSSAKYCYSDWETGYKEEGWDTFDDDRFIDTEDQPTHWMPLLINRNKS